MNLTDKDKYCKATSNSNLPAPHRFEIPVEWRYIIREHDLGNGTIIPYNVGKRVITLKCPCGKEVTRT